MSSESCSPYIHIEPLAFCTFATDQQVVVTHSKQLVVAATAIQQVRRGATPQRVVAIAAK